MKTTVCTRFRHMLKILRWLKFICSPPLRHVSYPMCSWATPVLHNKYERGGTLSVTYSEMKLGMADVKF